MNYFKFDKYEFINFRMLSNPELLMILEWRNNSEIRKWSFSKEIISIDEHMNFVELLRQNDNNTYWLVKKENRNIAVCNISNLHSKKPFFGFYLNPSLINTGIGAEVEFYFLKIIFDQLKISKIYGKVLKNNFNVLHIHKFFDFSIIEEIIENLEIYLIIQKNIQSYYYTEMTFTEFFKMKLKQKNEDIKYRNSNTG